MVILTCPKLAVLGELRNKTATFTEKNPINFSKFVTSVMYILYLYENELHEMHLTFNKEVKSK
jgi:hypothetical protein